MSENGGIKFEKNMATFIGILMLVLFLPVLFCVICIGSKMNYWEMMKPISVMSNLKLLIFLIPLFAVGIGILIISEKIEISEAWQKRIPWFFAVFAVGLYFLSDYICREIAFRIPWDVMVVRGAALELAKGKKLGNMSYFSMYTNNIPITYILWKMLEWIKEFHFKYNQEYIWLRANCVMMSAAVYFSAMTTWKVTKNLGAAILTFLSGVALIGLSGWKIAPYTDTYGMLPTVLCIYFYVSFKQGKKIAWRIVCLVATAFFGVLAWFIKPNLAIVLIAVFCAELIHSLSDLKKYWKEILIFAVCILACLVGFTAYKKSLPKKMGLELTENVEAGLAEFFYMGLNEERTGCYNDADLTVYGEFENAPRSEREKEVFNRAMKRLEEKGVAGGIGFALRKLTMTFNEGTFGWTNEVEIESHYLPIVSDNSKMMDYLRSFYWNGPRRPKFATFAQGAWLLVLLGIPWTAIAFLPVAAALISDRKDILQKEKALQAELRKHMANKEISENETADSEAQKNFENELKRKRDIEGTSLLAFLICFVGIVLYQLLFEARARYLFAFLPVIISMSIIGMWEVSFLASAAYKKLLGMRKKDGSRE